MSYRHNAHDDPGGGGAKHEQRSVVFEVLPPTYEHSTATMGGSLDEAHAFNTRHYSDSEDDDIPAGKAPFTSAPHSTGTLASRRYGTRHGRVQHGRTSTRIDKAATSESVEHMEGVREASLSSSVSTPSISQDSTSGSSNSTYGRMGSSLNLSKFGTTGAFKAEADEYDDHSSDSYNAHRRRHSSDQVPHVGFGWQVKSGTEVEASYEDTNDPQVVDLASWTPRSMGTYAGAHVAFDDVTQAEAGRGAGSMASPRSSASLTEVSSLSSPGFKVRKFSPSTHRKRRANVHSSKSRTYTATTAGDTYRYSFSSTTGAPSTTTVTPPRYRQFSYSSEAIMPSESLSSSSELARTAPSASNAFRASRTSAPTSPLGSQFSPRYYQYSATSSRSGSQQPLRFSSQSISETSGGHWSSSRGAAATTGSGGPAAPPIRSPPPKRKRRFSTSALDEPESGDVSQTEEDDLEASDVQAHAEYDQYGISDDSDPNGNDPALHSHRNRRSRRGNHAIEDEGKIDAQYMDASSPESSSSVLRTLLQTETANFDSGFDSSTHSGVDCTSIVADVDSSEFSDMASNSTTSSATSTASFSLSSSYQQQIVSSPDAVETYSTSERRHKGRSTAYDAGIDQQATTKERKSSSRSKRRSDEAKANQAPAANHDLPAHQTSSNEMNVDSGTTISTTTSGMASDGSNSLPNYESSSKGSRSSRSLKKRGSIQKDSIMQTDLNPMSESGSSTSSLNRALGAIPISSSSSSASPDSLAKRHIHAHTSPRLSSSSAPGSSSSNTRAGAAPLASASAANLHRKMVPDMRFADMSGVIDLSQPQQTPSWISNVPGLTGALKSDDPNLGTYRTNRRRSNAMRGNSSDDSPSDSDASYGADVDADVLTNEEQMLRRVISSGGDPSAVLQTPSSQTHQRPRSSAVAQKVRLAAEVTRHQGSSPRSTSLPEPPRQYTKVTGSSLHAHPEDGGFGLSPKSSRRMQGIADQRSPELDTIASSHMMAHQVPSTAFHTPSNYMLPYGASATLGTEATSPTAMAASKPSSVSDTETMHGIERKPKWTDEYGTDDDMVYHRTSNGQKMDSSTEDAALYAPFQLEKMDTDVSSGPVFNGSRQPLSQSSSALGNIPPLPIPSQRPASSIVSFPIVRSASQELATPARTSSAAPTPRNGRGEALVMKATRSLVQTYQHIQRNIKTRKDIEEAGARSKAATAPYYYPQVDEVLFGRYKIVGYLGRGSFGVVVKAIVLDAPTQPRSSVSSDTEDSSGGALGPDLRLSSDSVREEYLQPNKMVAIKISRKGASFLQQGKREVSILERIQTFQSTQPNQDLDLFVRALDSFFHGGHLCIVFELLADSLFDLVKYSWEVRPDRPGLSLRMVRKMTHQLICALITLRNSKIIHCDLKPENIALAQPNRPRLKILDFGSSCLVSDSPINQFPYIQSRYYRAPEILLGTGYSCAIDIWSLGCIIAELYLGRPIFEGSNSITQLYCIIDLLGMPTEAILKNSAHLSRYFQRAGLDPEGRSILDPTVKTHKFTRTTIRELIESKNEPNTPLHIRYFSDLISRMLEWDPTQRITPLEAVNHNFILYGPKTNGDGS